MRRVTDRQREILQYIYNYRLRHGYAPAMSEIAEEFSISSKQGVRRHLEALERKNCIVLTPRIARSVVITSRGQGLVDNRTEDGKVYEWDGGEGRYRERRGK